jgi:hypothetical protein
MNPAHFPQANFKFGPPSDLEESQCTTIPAFVGEIKTGSCDGCQITVVAWLPTPQELAELNIGKPIYLSVIGGLPPHFLSTDFQQAINPA